MSLPPGSLRQASSNHDTAYLARRSGVSPLLAPGDSVIDGRNSCYVDDIQRGKTLISMWGARVGAELDAEAGSKAARLAALNVLAVARASGDARQGDPNRPPRGLGCDFGRRARSAEGRGWCDTGL